MEKWVDYYSILQVHHLVEPDVLESAYKKLCKKYHPDLNPGLLAEQRMKQINIAYDVLRDNTKREAYYKEWLRRNAARPPYIHPYGAGQKPAATAGAGAADDSMQAQRVVSQYFTCISGGLYHDAFGLLSNEDKKKITFASFVEWQKMVAQTYEILNFEAVKSKRFEDFLSDSGASFAAERVTMRINERNIQTGGATSYQLVKFAIFEGGAWKIYLGYRDLDAIVNGFYVPAPASAGNGLEQWHLKPPAQLAGFLDYQTFLENIEGEIDRFNRYKRVFVLCVFQLAVNRASESVREQVIAVAGYTIKKLLRSSDCIAYIAEGYFGVLLVETKLGAAKKVAERLKQKAESEAWVCYDARLNIKYGLCAYSGEPIVKTIDSCMKMLKAN